MRHFASPAFWQAYERLPRSVQIHADRCFDLLKNDPFHPSLHFKKIRHRHSARIGLKYRALALEHDEGLIWYWIGMHDEYEKLITNQ